jgi:hypothetical protein
MAVQPVTQHVPQTRKAQDPPLPDNIRRVESFVRMYVEILLTRSHQAHRLFGESRPDNHRSQPKYIGLSLILRGLRHFPSNGRAPVEQF